MWLNVLAKIVYRPRLWFQEYFNGLWYNSSLTASRWSPSYLFNPLPSKLIFVFFSHLNVSSEVHTSIIYSIFIPFTESLICLYLLMARREILWCVLRITCTAHMVFMYELNRWTPNIPHNAYQLKVKTMECTFRRRTKFPLSPRWFSVKHLGETSS